MHSKRDKSESIYYEEKIWAALSNKWKISILLNLARGSNRFNQLQRDLYGISDKVLAATLKELEQDDLVYRVVYEEKVMKVEYNLTEKGSALLPIIQRLVEWWQK